jgi:polysaccharide biosynthesis protein PslG
VLRKLVGMIVVGLTATGVVTTGGALPAQAAAVPAFGVQFHATWSDYTDAERAAFLDKMAAAGVHWVRIDLGWRTFEERSKGTVEQWYVDLTDRVVDMARARGINVLATLWSTPAWANGGKSSNVAPTDVNEYARFAGWAASHYRGRIAAWEIWNEPNADGFWAGADPVRYAALVRAAYPAFKAGDPNALVVAGSVSLNDTTWLARMYDAGVTGSFDVLSTHPYPGPADAPPEVVDDGHTWQLDHIGAVHSLMVARGDGAKPVWATEYGWSSHANTGSEPTWKKGVTEAQQADYLVRSLSWFASRHPYVTNVFWYNDRNKATGDPQEDNYGLLYRNLTPKPAYTAVKALLTGSSATTGGSGTTAAPAPATTAPVPATAPAPVPASVSNSNPAPTTLSYRLVARDGRTFGYNEGGFLGTTGALPLGNHAIVAAVATPSGDGTWAVADNGAVFATSGAPFHGSAAGVKLNRPIVGMDATPSGNGYWLVASDGGIFAYGDARFFGSTGGMRLNKPIVGMAATPSGNGYWLVASDGGLFAYGDARFFGSTGSIRLNKPIVGMAPTPSGDGYWLVAEDGGIFAFNAPFYGSTGSIRLNQPITGMVPTPSGNGYWFAASDGGIFSFGDARFLGSGATTGAAFAGMVAPAR